MLTENKAGRHLRGRQGRGAVARSPRRCVYFQKGYLTAPAGSLTSGATANHAAPPSCKPPRRTAEKNFVGMSGQFWMRFRSLIQGGTVGVRCFLRGVPNRILLLFL